MSAPAPDERADGAGPAPRFAPGDRVGILADGAGRGKADYTARELTTAVGDTVAVIHTRRTRHVRVDVIARLKFRRPTSAISRVRHELRDSVVDRSVYSL